MNTDNINRKMLIVDDSLDTLELLNRNLSGCGYVVHAANNVDEALRLIDSVELDVVITDLKMPKGSGMDLVKYVKENKPDTQVMMITGYATVEGAVKAVKAGAEEYLSKPFTDEELFSAVESALKKLDIRRKLNDIGNEPEKVKGIIGKSAVMRRIYNEIEKASKSDATVIVTGDSGTGKELVARAIHYSSKRGRAPFVPVNCGGIPEGLLESELFGHVRGAFTGATETRAGFFQTAEGGTIFLDEISETSLQMQVKLLRVLQDGEITMVGATKSNRADIRIIAATNKDLEKMVRRGSFREDLFFRLNVININVPALRERGDDIFLLTRHFLNKFSNGNRGKIPEFQDEALSVMKKYNWPGNVRELENMIQRLVVMKEGDTIDVTDLPRHMKASLPRVSGLDRTLAEVEAEYIKTVLESVNGNKTKASKILGIDRKTLREKIKNRQIS